MFDAQVWGLDRKTLFAERQSQLAAAAAVASSGKRLQQRLDLARFYIARECIRKRKACSMSAWRKIRLRRRTSPAACCVRSLK